MTAVVQPTVNHLVKILRASLGPNPHSIPFVEPTGVRSHKIRNFNYVKKFAAVPDVVNFQPHSCMKLSSCQLS